MTQTTASESDLDRAETRAAWRQLLACPECVAPLPPDESPTCPGCGRQFTAAGDALNLLPAGVASPESRDISGFDDSWKRRFIQYVYARHNHAPVIADALARVTSDLDGGGWGLNLGSGNSAIHSQLVNVDITNNAGVQVLADAHRLPFQPDSLRCVVSQEVLEHLHSPRQALLEAYRVLRPGGTLFVQVPFIIGLHSLPHDYWRFSKAGLSQIVAECGFDVLECRAAGGAGTSMYRISTEFFAAIAASLARRLYLPAKATAAFFLSPLRMLDRFTSRDDAETNRIAAGYYCIAQQDIVRRLTFLAALAASQVSACKDCARSARLNVCVV